MNACFKSCEGVGRSFHSLFQQAFKKLLAEVERSSGISGSSEAILNKHATGFNWWNGGLPITDNRSAIQKCGSNIVTVPVNSSNTRQPSDQISAGKEYSSAFITSGAVYHGVPTVDLRHVLNSNTLVDVPKSINLI